jgi:hypothetical protein
MQHGAELIVKVGDKGRHRDGDILYAADRRRIMQVHGEMICHVKRAGRCTPQGHRPIGLAYHWQDATYRYCFSRVSKWEVVREDRWEGKIQTFSNRPTETRPGKWDAINVPLYIERRLRHHRHRIFGLPGREIWFGGDVDQSAATISRVWNRITLETGIDPGSLRWPAGRLDLVHHLVLPLAHDLPMDDYNHLVGQRVAWRQMLPVSLVRLIDTPGRPVDLRRRRVAVSLMSQMVEAV